MNRNELRALAVDGVRHKLQVIERVLADYFKEWPELFISPTPPQLLKAPMKNGAGPSLADVVTATLGRETPSATRKAYLPARNSLRQKVLDFVNSRTTAVTAGDVIAAFPKNDRQGIYSSLSSLVVHDLIVKSGFSQYQRRAGVSGPVAPTMKPYETRGNSVRKLVLDFINRQTAPVSMQDVQQALPKLKRKRNAASTALSALTHHGVIQRVGYNTYTRLGAPLPTSPITARSSWTPAMRAAAAKRMRARWRKDPEKLKRAAAKGLRAMRARQAQG